MLPREIKIEDDLEAYMIRNFSNNFPVSIYPKVTQIAGKTISEIDLLGIEDNCIRCYVFKFLNFKSNDANYKQICAGIGQALLYLNYGIDVAYLVLGISEKAENKHLTQKLNYVENLYLFLVYSGCRRFQFWVWNQKTNQLITSKEEYPMPARVTPWWYITTLSRQNIFDNKFVWTKGKKFCEKYGIKYDEKKGCLRI